MNNEYKNPAGDTPQIHREISNRSKKAGGAWACYELVNKPVSPMFYV